MLGNLKHSLVADILESEAIALDISTSFDLPTDYLQNSAAVSKWWCTLRVLHHMNSLLSLTSNPIISFTDTIHFHFSSLSLKLIPVAKFASFRVSPAKLTFSRLDATQNLIVKPVLTSSFSTIIQVLFYRYFNADHSQELADHLPQSRFTVVIWPKTMNHIEQNVGIFF